MQEIINLQSIYGYYVDKTLYDEAADLFAEDATLEIAGRGLFRGIEIVADKETKTPFDPALKLHARIKKEAMARGLLCYPMGGTIDGRLGDHVLLAPPYIIAPEEIDQIVERIAGAIDAAVRG